MLLPLLGLGLAAAVYLATRKGGTAPSTLPKSTMFPSSEPLPKSDSKAVSEGLSGSEELPFDPAALGLSSGLQTILASGWDGLPFDLGTGAPADLGTFLGSAGSRATAVSPPKGASLASSTDPAPAPLPSGTRVTFALDQLTADGKVFGAVLEGLYNGPSSMLSSEGSTVLVDRIALVGASDPETGRYTLPPSKRDYESTWVSRVRWTPLYPADKGLEAVKNAPVLEKGDKLTLVCEDGFGSVVIWIGQVHEPRGGGYAVILQKAHKALKDVGDGKFSPPLFLDQAIVEATPAMFVDPKSIP